MTSFTIPKDPGVLRAMATYLQLQADTIDEPVCKHCGCTTEQDVEPAIEVDEGGTLDDTVQVQTDFPAIEAAAAHAATGGPSEAAVAFGQADAAPDHNTVDVAPPPPAATLPAVELDSDGLPWDARINTPSKLKLSKEKTWKLIRSIETKSPGLVEQVRAELRATMAAPAAEAGSSELPPQSSAVVQTAAPAPHAEMAAPAPPAASTVVPVASGEIAAPYPLFMRKVTAAGIATEAVLAAVQSVGIPSIVLVSSRPDLIPAVEAILFPEA